MNNYTVLNYKGTKEYIIVDEQKGVKIATGDIKYITRQYNKLTGDILTQIIYI